MRNRFFYIYARQNANDMRKITYRMNQSVRSNKNVWEKSKRKQCEVIMSSEYKGPQAALQHGHGCDQIYHGCNTLLNINGNIYSQNEQNRKRIRDILVQIIIFCRYYFMCFFSLNLNQISGMHSFEIQRKKHKIISIINKSEFFRTADNVYIKKKKLQKAFLLKLYQICF